MDREEGFPPHIIGFMRRKREKQKPDDAKSLRSAPHSEESGRTHQTT